MNPYLTNRMRYNAATTANNTYVAKTGEVTGFNPQSWSINVTFYPLSSDDGYEVGAVEIPLSASWVGNGWGLYCAPSLGTEVTVLFANGNLQEPIGLGFIFSGNVQPVQGIQSEECWLVHKSGSTIKLTNDGKITISSTNEVDVQAPVINANGTTSVSINAPTINAIAQTLINLTAPSVNISTPTGSTAPGVNISANGIEFNLLGAALHKLVTDVFVGLFNGHTHPTDNSGESGPPNQTMNNTHLTVSQQAI